MTMGREFSKLMGERSGSAWPGKKLETKLEGSQSDHFNFQRMKLRCVFSAAHVE